LEVSAIENDVIKKQHASASVIIIFSLFVFITTSKIGNFMPTRARRAPWSAAAWPAPYTQVTQINSSPERAG
jgi:hypothetical protein